MMRLIKLVGPLTGYMALAVVMGVLGNACASSITILGGFAVARVLGLFDAVSLGALFAVAAAAAVARGLLRYAEQSCNHFIAFKLLALIRDRVFGALRRLCPAKLEGDKGDLISVITGDIELLEVFYAHTVSPVCIAVLFCAAMIVLIGRYHALLGLLAAVVYLTVGVAVPLVAAHYSRAAARNVTFSYGAQSILNDLSVDFPQGKMIGIVGQSGCGKSTLLKLLMRFWQVDGGSISIRQTNIDEINTSDLRNMESYVTQQTHLFHDSIRSNLCVAKPDATDEDLIRACKKASIHDFIASLPQGYDTPVGELGGTLSGGVLFRAKFRSPERPAARHEALSGEHRRSRRRARNDQKSETPRNGLAFDGDRLCHDEPQERMDRLCRAGGRMDRPYNDFPLSR